MTESQKITRETEGGDQMAEHHPEPKLIPNSPEFPVTWTDPKDEKLPLVQDP